MGTFANAALLMISSGSALLAIKDRIVLQRKIIFYVNYNL